MASITVGKNIRKTLFWEIEYFQLFYSCVSLASLYSFFSSLSMVNVCEVTKCHLFYLTPKLMLNFIPPRHTHGHPPIFFLEGAILSGFIQERNIIARHFVHIKQRTGVVGENR